MRHTRTSLPKERTTSAFHGAYDEEGSAMSGRPLALLDEHLLPLGILH